MTSFVLLLHVIALSFVIPEYVDAARDSGKSGLVWGLLSLPIYLFCIALALLPIYLFAGDATGVWRFALPIIVSALGASLAMGLRPFIVKDPDYNLPTTGLTILSLGVTAIYLVNRNGSETIKEFILDNGGPWKSGLAGEFQFLGVLADFNGLMIITAIVLGLLALLALFFNRRLTPSGITEEH